MVLALVQREVGEGDDVGVPTTLIADDLAGYVRRELEDMNRFRTLIGLEQRLLKCARMREGQYEPADMAEVQAIGGSEVYVRLASNKIRASYAVLAGIFLQGERPWNIGPTPDPTLPDNIIPAIQQTVAAEIANLKAAGTPPQPAQVRQRVGQLMNAADNTAKKKARADALEATTKLDDICVEGGLYEALADFLIDFVTYPVAFLRGPTVVMKTDVHYVEGKPVRQRRPVLTFERVSPHDLLWTSGAARIEEAGICERRRMHRADLQALRGIPGFDDAAIVSALRDYGDRGYADPVFMVSGRDELENQPSSIWTDTIDVIVYTGPMTGRMLEEFGVSDSDIEGGLDVDMEYLVSIYLCDRYVLKIQIDPDPRNRVPYYCAAYEPIPGSIVGSALPELMGDVQEIVNSIGRGICNNISLSSGPQVVVDVTRLENIADAETFYPWKRWRFNSEPATAAQKAIEFFQPNSNVGELIQAFAFFSTIADEVSSVPKYMTGNEKVGGAGRTSSGLSMLMSNANRSMTSIAASVDNVLECLIQKLYDLILLATGDEYLRGDENIVVKGATYAQTKETDRMRMIEFLQLTMNPIDSQIMGLPGRATLLKRVSDTLGLEGDDIIPTPEELAAQAQQAQLEQQGAVANGQEAVPPGGPGGNGEQGGQPVRQGQEGQKGQERQGRPVVRGQGQGQGQGGGQSVRLAPPKASSQAQAEETDNMHRTRRNPAK
jgi:hypothetical protein